MSRVLIIDEERRRLRRAAALLRAEGHDVVVAPLVGQTAEAGADLVLVHRFDPYRAGAFIAEVEDLLEIDALHHALAAPSPSSSGRPA